MPVQRCGDFVEREAQLFGFHHQLFQLLFEKRAALGSARRGGLGDHGANTGAHFEYPFVDQLENHFVRGVGIDFQIAAEGADGRKRVAGPHLAGDDGFLGSVDDLFVNGDAWLECQAERDHTVYYIT